MPVLASSLDPSGLPAAAHGADLAWALRLLRLSQWLTDKGISPARVVVVVPYAQLMDAGRRAWAKLFPSGFAPRFESSRNWATNLAPFAPGAMDWSGDLARDSLIAAAFVDSVEGALRGRSDPALRATLVSRLVEATRSLAPLGASVPPENRTAWGQDRLEALAPGLQNPLWEGLIATLALTWASNSAYATDVLWGPLAQPGGVADGLWVLQGFQSDPLANALVARWGDDRGRIEALWEDGAAGETVAEAGSLAIQWHACGDAEHEA
ncbi:MAG: PD-(D/E)XK nuclease family protein, partial [Hydrogenophaga sp.]